MRVAICIEDNCLKVSVLNEAGYPTSFEFAHGQEEFEGQLIVRGNHVFTGRNIHPVKMANPELIIFERVLIPGAETYKDAENRIWERWQLYAVLVKKILFLINTRQVQEVTSIVISCPSYFSEKDRAELQLAFQANGIGSVHFAPNILGRIVEDDREGKYFVCQINESLFREAFHATPEIKCGLRHILLQSFESASGALNSRNKAFDQYVLDYELGIVLDDILQGKSKDSYFIILGHKIVEYRPPRNEIQDKIVEVLKENLSTGGHLTSDSVLFTGRFLKFDLIRKNLIAILEGGDQVLDFDESNEWQVKRLLEPVLL